MRADPWYGTIFLFLEQIAPSWRHISALIHAGVVGSRVDVVTLCDEMVRVARFSCRFFTAVAGNKAEKKNQNSSMYLLCSDLTEKVCFSGSRISNLVPRTFSSGKRSWERGCECIKSARRLVIRVNVCVCSVEKSSVKSVMTVYSGIELICEFAKIRLIITKTCFDSFLLFLLVWLLCKSFW